MVLLEDGFPQKLGGEEALGFVGELVLVVKGRMLRQQRHAVPQHLVDAALTLRGDRQHGRSRELIAPLLLELLDGSILQPPVLDLLGEARRALGRVLLRVGRRVGQQVNLVEQHEHRRRRAAQSAQDLLVGKGVGEILKNVDDQEDDVGVDDGGTHKGHHALLQLVLRPQHPRGVRVHDLVVGPVVNAHDAVTCRLGLGGGDRELFAEQAVHERALADIWHAENAHKPSAVRSAGGGWANCSVNDGLV